MRSTFRRFVLTLAVVAASSATAFTAPPQLVNYQGEVTDGGAPVANGNYPMEFRVFALSAGGVALWSEAVANVSVNNGRFNVLLGQVTALPENIFDGTERWLEAVFNAEVITPRVRLVTVPYAHRISTVDGATGGDISTQVRISTTDIGQSLEVFNSVAGARVARFENTNLANSEAVVLGVNNGTGAAVTGFSPNGGTAMQSAGDLVVDDFNFNRKFAFDATGPASGGELSGFASTGTETVELLTSEAVGQGALLRLRQADGNNGIILDGDNIDYGEMRFNKGAINTMTLQGGSGSTGSLITMRDDGGTTTISLDADVSSGDGRISVSSGTDVSATGGGFIVLGSTSATSIAIDDNEISARNNGVYADLHLQPNGGGVGIGANSLVVPAGYIFAVDGKGIMEEVEVSLSQDWPDYVFEPGYDLMPLSELERHLKDKKHLPGIPTQEDMKDARLPLGEMQTKLLEKVEELTLYILDLQKQLDATKSSNESLRERIQAIEANRN